MFKLKSYITYKDLYILLLSLYFMCLPLGAMSLGALGSALRYIAVLPIGVALIGSRKFYVNSPFLMYALFVFFSFFTVLWSINIDDSKSAIISQVMLLGLLASGTMFHYSEKDIFKLKKALAWSSRLSAVVLIAFGILVEGRLMLSGIILENPNYFCTYLIFGIIFALERILIKGSFKLKILPMCELIAFLTIILLTGSRGGLLSTAAGIFAFLLFSGKKGQKRILLKLLICILIILAVILLIEQLPEELKSRFSVENVEESGGSGRTTIWKNAINSFIDANVFYKIFGHGMGTIGSTFRFYGYPVVDSHNAFVGNLLLTGLMGLLLYILAILTFIKKSLSFDSKFAFGVMFAIFVFTFGASATTLKPYFNIMLYIIISLNTEASKSKDEVLKI